MPAHQEAFIQTDDEVDTLSEETILDLARKAEPCMPEDEDCQDDWDYVNGQDDSDGAAAKNPWTPPQDVQRAASRGLALREKFGRGGTMVGVARARDLSNGKKIPIRTIMRMKSYFARHEVDKRADGWGDSSNPSPGWIAWLLWGGDPGRRWAERIASEYADEAKKAEPIIYGWVGVSGNAYKDKENDIIPLAVMEQDIRTSYELIKAQKMPHHGWLDVMHNHAWTIGTCAYRSIIPGTRMELNYGYVDPQFNAVAEKCIADGTPLTMSREFVYWLKVGKTAIKIPTSLGRTMFAQKSLGDIVKISTYRFTVAKRGMEANALTVFKFFKLANGHE